ncbi:MAG: thiamine pyrophosphate-dependent enzyme, partial [Bdellovibrionota bacterium]
IFGEYVRCFNELPCPTPEISPTLVLTTAAQLVSRSKGRNPGPVHLNCLFREPLAPTVVDQLRIPTFVQDYYEGAAPFTKESPSVTSPAHESLKSIARELDPVSDGVVVLGELSNQIEPFALRALLSRLSWPVIPDVLSGFRQESNSGLTIHLADLLLQERDLWPGLQPQAVLHIGGKLTSKRIQQWIAASRPRVYVKIQNSESRLDPDHQIRTRCVGDIEETCALLGQMILPRPPSSWTRKWLKLNETTARFSNVWFQSRMELTEPRVAHDLSELAPSDSTVILASSMPIRDYESFSIQRSQYPKIISNRGASGIDGTLATASGVSRASQRSVTLLIGDLALLHDLNSLAVVRACTQPLVIVTINNDGGGIFSFLPISETTDVFEPYFTTPHGLSFKSAAATFEIPYFSPRSVLEFRKAYLEALCRPGPTLIEVTTSRAENVRLHREMSLLLKSKLNGEEQVL